MTKKADSQVVQEGILATAARGNITKERLDDIYEEVQSIYLSDQRPWVLGYSGGKDSTAKHWKFYTKEKVSPMFLT